jgi:uncharacterized sulfatase
MYMGMISHIDDQFGRLLDGLEEMGVADNTVIYFTSDHGDMMGEHWFVGKRLFFYDGALKVPGIMAGPGIPQNTKVKRLAETVDMTPTILDLCGIKPDPEIQGKSWKSVFDDESEILHDDVYTEFQYHHNRTGTPEDFENNQHTFSIFDGRYRIVCFKKRKYGQLFDMEKDPGCHVNFWDDPEYTEIKQDMKEKLLNRLMNNLSRPDTRKADW